MNPRVLIDYGDITRQHVDAIVNAANASLLGGGGVDGAIHRAAGPRLLEECRGLGGCPAGQARLTRGYDLPASWVIHTVGPIWRGGTQGEEETLAACYRSCFEVAAGSEIRTLAFPSIATGAYGFPVDRACRIALREIEAGLASTPRLESVAVVCYDRDTLERYLAANDVSRSRDA